MCFALLTIAFSMSTQAVLVIDAEHVRVKSQLIEIARAETGIDISDSATTESRLISVGSSCHAANYRFFLEWDGEASTAHADDEAVEVLCSKTEQAQDWRCAVEVKHRTELLALESTEALCDA